MNPMLLRVIALSEGRIEPSVARSVTGWTVFNELPRVELAPERTETPGLHLDQLAVSTD
jgi:hypothetical protein